MAEKDEIKICQYGENCYRKNKEHIKDYHQEPPNKKIKLSPEQQIENMFLVKMPQDFIQLWRFCNSINPDKPRKTFHSVGLEMGGAYDVLDDTLPSTTSVEDCILHHRYYYDPPEFQTVLVSTENNSEYHIGYYRDSPEEMPCFVASNDSNKDCKILPLAETIFGAIVVFLEEAKKASPFKSMACQQLINKLKNWAKDENISLETNSTSMKKRQKAVVAKTFHGAGIVVPVDKKTELGYRPLIEKDAKLKEMLSRYVKAEDDDEKKAALAKLQPIITMANIATDECDFGTGLEIGIDFFCMGDKSLHSFAGRFLSVAYKMLDREVYAKISEAHLKNRRKGNKMSILNGETKN